MTKSFTKLFSAIVFVLFAAALSGQATFSVTPVEAYLNWNSFQASATIKNLTNEDISVRWTKKVIFAGQDSTCQFGVFDPFVEVPPNFTTRLMPLPAGFEGEIGIWLLGCEPDTNNYCAVLLLQMKNVKVPSDTIDVLYVLGNCPVVSTEEKPIVQISCSPNPVQAVITLINAEAVEYLRIFDNNGRAVARFNAAPNQNYDLSPLPSGNYILLAEDKNHQFLQVLKIQKR